MPTWAIAAKTSGWCSLIQRNRAGEVMATQSPPVSKSSRAWPASMSSRAWVAERESTLGQAQISRPAAS